MDGVASRLVLIVAGITAASRLAAQPAAPSFDVASVKPSPPPEGDTYRANLGSTVHGEVRLSNTTLSECLRFAYGISNDSQVSGPDWIKNKDVRFEIDAKAPPDTPREQLLVMLQTLLVERFRLETHREQKDLAYLALVPGKQGSKLRESSEATGASGNTSIPGRIISNRMMMSMLTTLLSRFLRQPVVDLTGLKGWYEVRLEWTPDNVVSPPLINGEPMRYVDKPIFAAVQDQLGLRLESRKGPVEVLAVDHAERVPIGN